MLPLYRMSHVIRVLKAFPRHAPYSSWKYHKMVIGSLRRDPGSSDKLIDSLRKERCYWPGSEKGDAAGARDTPACAADSADKADPYNDRTD